MAQEEIPIIDAAAPGLPASARGPAAGNGSATGNGSAPTGVPASAAPRVRTVDVHRYGPDAVALEVHLGQYREVFFVLTGDKSVTITMLDESDPTHHEAQVFVFAKPWQWSLDGSDEEILLQVWQSVGVQR